MPASRNACSYARRWLSVSTVPPDLLDTTSTVRSSAWLSAERTQSGALESSTVSGTAVSRGGGVGPREGPARRGADDLGCQRRAAHAGEDDVVHAVRDELAAD